MNKEASKKLQSKFSGDDYDVGKHLNKLLNDELEDDIEIILIAIIDSKLINIVETKAMLIRENEMIT